MKRGTVFCDGGSRGTPGPFACAAVLEVEGDSPRKQARYLGPKGTNNQAELYGLMMGMRMAADAGVTHLQVRLDSKLVVEQALGAWKIKNAALKVLHEDARRIALEFFEDVTIRHVRREKNKEADALCTTVLDRATGRPRRVISDRRRPALDALSDA